MGIYECDDGNAKNRDGCNSECRIEESFNCSGGSAISKDSCRDSRMLIFRAILSNHSCTMNFIFNKNITIASNKTASDIFAIEALVHNMTKKCKFILGNDIILFGGRKLRVYTMPSCNLNGTEVRN